MPSFAHLRNLTDGRGLWEHALYTTPRVEHGYCTDDNARGLVVVLRHAAVDVRVADLAATYFAFVLDAVTPSGQFHNRLNADGVWTDTVGSDDCQGRAIWALGTAARLGIDSEMRDAAADAFDKSTVFASQHLRANAFAALGASEYLRSDQRPEPAFELLERTTTMLARATRARIPWPEVRLTYDNARLPEAMMAAGSALGDRRRLAIGVRLLDWLLDAETVGDHLSFTPVGGRVPGEMGSSFDQQPIEAWAMADAAHRAWSITGEDRWRNVAISAAAWLVGRNDTGAVLYDKTTGGTGDGLTATSINENRGAESTLSGIAALQVAATLRETLL